MTDEKIIELNNGTARTAKRALGMHSAKRDAPAQLEWKRRFGRRLRAAGTCRLGRD